MERDQALDVGKFWVRKAADSKLFCSKNLNFINALAWGSVAFSRCFSLYFATTNLTSIFQAQSITRGLLRPPDQKIHQPAFLPQINTDSGDQRGWWATKINLSETRVRGQGAEALIMKNYS